MAKARTPIIGGNWKMNTTLPDAAALAQEIVRALGLSTPIDVVLFPPFPNLRAVYDVIGGTNLALGAQDLFWEDRGAFTGEVSASMLLAAGCTWALVGHSERRHILGESDSVVNRKLQAALRNGLLAVLAVGESKFDRDGGTTEAVLENQLRGSLDSISAESMAGVVIAYEPVWAIGTGVTATPEQARDAHACVRRVLSDLYGAPVAERTRIQYGGSVTAQNAAQLMAQPGIDGALIGGASLKPEDFATIVRAASSQD